MAISGIGSSYNQIGTAANYVQEKATAKEAGRKAMMPCFSGGSS